MKRQEREKSKEITGQWHKGWGKEEELFIYNAMKHGGE